MGAETLSSLVFLRAPVEGKRALYGLGCGLWMRILQTQPAPLTSTFVLRQCSAGHVCGRHTGQRALYFRFAPAQTRNGWWLAQGSFRGCFRARLRRCVVMSGLSVAAPEGDAEGGQGAVGRHARTTSCPGSDPSRRRPCPGHACRPEAGCTTPGCRWSAGACWSVVAPARSGRCRSRFQDHHRSR
jgi:hypothetical protein